MKLDLLDLEEERATLRHFLRTFDNSKIKRLGVQLKELKTIKKYSDGNDEIDYLYNKLNRELGDLTLEQEKAQGRLNAIESIISQSYDKALKSLSK